uniref:Uncharacterized protein n=1 Tax=Timema genevievae TaxID=629358 RepID=A0A7R9JXG9_TIMGE|nr:unnamed protein product [Timema genevievae]
MALTTQYVASRVADVGAWCSLAVNRVLAVAVPYTAFLIFVLPVGFAHWFVQVPRTSLAVVSSHGVIPTMRAGPGLVLVALVCPPTGIAVPACAVLSENIAACLSGVTLKPEALLYPLPDVPLLYSYCASSPKDKQAPHALFNHKPYSKVCFDPPYSGVFDAAMHISNTFPERSAVLFSLGFPGQTLLCLRVVFLLVGVTRGLCPVECARTLEIRRPNQQEVQGCLVGGIIRDPTKWRFLDKLAAEATERAKTDYIRALRERRVLRQRDNRRRDREGGRGRRMTVTGILIVMRRWKKIELGKRGAGLGRTMVRSQRCKHLPHSYSHQTNKEKLILWYAENCRRQFHFLHPDRRPQFLAADNECGIQKMVCTTIRPTSVPYPEFSTWQGCAKFVSDHLLYKPLEKPTLLERSETSVKAEDNSGSLSVP